MATFGGVMEAFRAVAARSDSSGNGKDPVRRTHDGLRRGTMGVDSGNRRGQESGSATSNEPLNLRSRPLIQYSPPKPSPRIGNEYFENVGMTSHTSCVRFSKRTNNGCDPSIESPSRQYADLHGFFAVWSAKSPSPEPDHHETSTCPKIIPA